MNKMILAQLTEALKILYAIIELMDYHALTDLKRELSLLEQSITMQQGELMKKALLEKSKRDGE